MKNLKILSAMVATSAFFFTGCFDSEFETKQFTIDYLRNNPQVAEKLAKWCDENKHKELGTNGMLNCQLIKMELNMKKATGEKRKGFDTVGF